MNILTAGDFPQDFGLMAIIYMLRLIFQSVSCLISMTLTPLVDKMKLIVVIRELYPNPMDVLDEIATSFRNDSSSCVIMFW